jgi:hypothetical protein
MKYTKTFREALNDVDKKDKPEAKPEAKVEKPVEDKDETIKKLQDQIQKLELDLKLSKDKALKPEPNKETGEIPLRTGVAKALLDKDGPQPKIDKENKKKFQMSLGKSKVTIDPDVAMGVYSGGKEVGSGNLH